MQDGFRPELCHVKGKRSAAWSTCWRDRFYSSITPAAKAAATVLVTCDLKVVPWCLSPSHLQSSCRWLVWGAEASAWKKRPVLPPPEHRCGGPRARERRHVAHGSKSPSSVFSLIGLSLAQAKLLPSVFPSSSVWIFR